MYHPYCHGPSALTEYLKQKLHLQRAKRLGHSLPAQVEPSVQLECNIPVVVIISVVLTVIAPIVCIVLCMEWSSGALTCHLSGSTAMGKGNYALRFGEAESVGVRAIIVGVVATFTVETVFV